MDKVCFSQAEKSQCAVVTINKRDFNVSFDREK